MSQIRELLLAHIGYSAWATRRVLEACSHLTKEQLESSLGASHSSILGTFRHIYDGERVWLVRLGEGSDGRLPAGPAPNLSFESLIQSWPGLWEGYHKWLETVTEADLNGEVSTILPDGLLFRVPRWQIVLHAINHSSFHRGQIITMLRGSGQTPPNTDLTAYHATP